MSTKLVSTGGRIVLSALAVAMIVTVALLNIARSQVDDALEGLPGSAWHLRPTWSSSAGDATTYSFRSRN